MGREEGLSLARDQFRVEPQSPDVFHPNFPVASAFRSVYKIKPNLIFCRKGKRAIVVPRPNGIAFRIGVVGKCINCVRLQGVVDVPFPALLIEEPESMGSLADLYPERQFLQNKFLIGPVQHCKRKMRATNLFAPSSADMVLAAKVRIDVVSLDLGKDRLPFWMPVEDNLLQLFRNEFLQPGEEVVGGYGMNNGKDRLFFLKLRFMGLRSAMDKQEAVPSIIRANPLQVHSINLEVVMEEIYLYML